MTEMLLGLALSPSGYEVAWDYCLEHNIIMPVDPVLLPFFLEHDRCLWDVRHAGYVDMCHSHRENKIPINGVKEWSRSCSRSCSFVGVNNRASKSAC